MNAFGRIPSRPDPRNQNFLMRAALPVHPRPSFMPPVQLWWPGRILDQGDTPRCTSFGFGAWRQAWPVPDSTPTPEDLQAFYVAEQQVDGFDHTQPLPDDHNDTGGSSVHAGAQVAKSLHLLDTYLWATDISDVTRWLLLKGPVVLGIDWYAGFSSPDASGLVGATGSVLGGHCVCAVGYDLHTDTILIQNSWGLSWGSPLFPGSPSHPSTPRSRGFFRMKGQTLATLLASGGEACTGLELAHAA